MRILLLVLMLSGCASMSQQSAPMFAGAILENGRIRFDPMDDIDWQAAATREAIGFDVDRLTDADVAMLYARNNVYTDAEADFPVSISARMRRACHRLLSPDGIHRVQVESLRGTARFAFNDASPPQVVRRIFFGAAYIAPARADGGFIMRTESCGVVRAVDDETVALERAAGQTLLHYRDASANAEMAMPQPWFTEFVTAYGITISGRRYLFVKWPSDEAGVATAMCASNFSLYAVEQALSLVASNNYDCDV